ncbi:MAG: hypothetical protein OHK0029_13130 [Armatimonadaceae bacterium]
MYWKEFRFDDNPDEEDDDNEPDAIPDNRHARTANNRRRFR